MHDQTRTPALDERNVGWQTWAIIAALSAFGLFLLALMLTGQVWRAVAYGVIALFGFLIALAVYFWGAMLFGSTLEMLARQRQGTVSWSMIGENLVTPKHDIDPGLELLSAGILVYRLGEVKPQPYFRKVPLGDARAVRPFMIARTGAERNYRFSFLLNDEVETTRFDNEFVFALKDEPQVVMPPCRLVVDRPRALIGQRWTLRVQSGLTVVTSFRFIFVEGSAQPGIEKMGIARNGSGNGSRLAADGGLAEWQECMLPELLDEAVKRDAMSSTQDIVLEVV